MAYKPTTGDTTAKPMVKLCHTLMLHSSVCEVAAWFSGTSVLCGDCLGFVTLDIVNAPLGY
ncbi:MAG TPA: hypothetical protein PLB54_09320 [Nitrosomonas sp.]|nr:hypothetical protein [Nitrosomonas sp.]